MTSRSERVENARVQLAHFRSLLPEGAESREWWASEVAKQERLFTPAPEPMPGQTEMPGDFDG